VLGPRSTISSRRLIRLLRNNEPRWTLTLPSLMPRMRAICLFECCSRHHDPLLRFAIARLPAHKTLRSSSNVEEHVVTFSKNLAAEMATPWDGEPELSLSQQTHCAAVYGWPRRLREWRQVIRWVCDQSSRSEAGKCTP
jgi:hypothetical protein